MVLVAGVILGLGACGDDDAGSDGRPSVVVTTSILGDVVTSLLGNLGFPEAVRQILFGSIIVVVAAAYTRVTAES